MSEQRVLDNLKKGLRKKADQLLPVSSLEVKGVSEFTSAELQQLVISGRFHALIELHNDFENVFDIMNGVQDKSLCGFQNGLFQRYREIQAKHGFKSGTTLSLLAGKPREVILDYGRMIEMMSLANDAISVIALGASSNE